MTFRYGKRFQSELEKFRDYLADYSSPPKFWEGQGKPCKMPWPLPSLAHLVLHGRMSLDEAWDFPVGLAAWIVPALQEASGSELNIVGADEAAALKEAGYVS